MLSVRCRLVGVLLLVGGTAVLNADEGLKGIACRSVHLAYPGPAGVAFYNEVKVERSAEGTYFAVCGFNGGYFGIQEKAGGKKVVIFSVWDPTKGDDPKAVKEEQRVQVVHQDPEVRVGRFGGEGTGGQSFWDYDWKVGEVYRFLVQAKVNGPRTEYAAHFYHPEKKAWKHLATFSTLAKGNTLENYYSFVEDFRRNRVSATQERRARYGNGWVKKADGQWVALTRARFTADRNPVVNIDAGVEGSWFFLATGGETKNTGTALGKTMDRPPTGVDLPDAK
jgi:hypothetical protein